ncbi:MAG: hypothetical protein ACTSQE_02500 [Candidatus Heimdallarchaeaceae archaeon]
MIATKTTIRTTAHNLNSEHYNGYHIILAHLEASSLAKRRIGYALCIPQYQDLPQTIQEIVRQKWLSDPDKYLFDETFQKLCNKVFAFKEF